jgi:hypothetical protein
MESSDLFSHPAKPEVAASGESSKEPAQYPTFSDLPKKKPSATPPDA